MRWTGALRFGAAASARGLTVCFKDFAAAGTAVAAGARERTRTVIVIGFVHTCGLNQSHYESAAAAIW